MPSIKRNDIPQLLKKIADGETARVYLLLGERYLCKEAAERLIAALLAKGADNKNSLTLIDGEEEDPARTLASLRTFSLFGGVKLFQVINTQLFLSKSVSGSLWDKALNADKEPGDGNKKAGRMLLQMLAMAELAPEDWRENMLAETSDKEWKKLFGFDKPADVGWADKLINSMDTPPALSLGKKKSDLSQEYQQALEQGLPPGNILILQAETVDKRKRLFKYLDKNEQVIDLTVDSGISAGAKKAQNTVLVEMAKETLKRHKKTIAPGVLDQLIERIGFHPVAVVMECEKLAFFAGEKNQIDKADVDTMVARTKEDAIFELSEAYSKGRLEQSLALCQRLRLSGMHSLAIIAGLRNHIRKLMLAKSLSGGTTADFQTTMPYPRFTKRYLPELKEQREAQGKSWPASLPNHPYALYQVFLQAESLGLTKLKSMLSDLLAAEYRLKGSGLNEEIVMTALMLAACLDSYKGKGVF